MTSLVTVYDVAQAGFTTWATALGLIGLVVAAILLLLFVPKQRTLTRLAVLATSLTLIVVLTTQYVGHRRLRNRLRAGQYEAVEGFVTIFLPGGGSSHRVESFDVGRHTYTYWTSRWSPGFRRGPGPNAVLRDKAYVRIADVDGKIAKLEIAQGGPSSAAATLQLPEQSCDSLPIVTCFRDIAHMGDDPNAGASADWIWFGAAGDSIEIFAPPGSYISTNFGQEHDRLHNTARYFRHRLTSDGVVAIWVTMDEFLGDSLGYTLRIRREGTVTPTWLRATGQWAKLTIESRRQLDPFSVIPMMLARSVRDRSKWKVLPRTYNVALVGDSLYEVCRLPCSSPDTVKLTPSASVTRRY
jgi:hypothetical protein